MNAGEFDLPPSSDESRPHREPAVAAPLPESDDAPILVVDDNPANLLTYRTILADLREPIHMADSGEAALRKLLATDFAVILLDVNLPGMSGFETAAMIRKRKRSEHTPIIFASAISVEDTHAYRGYSLGGVDYIFAPIVPEVLTTKIRVFVELYKQRRAVQRQAEQLRILEEAQHRQTAAQLHLALDAGRMGVWELDLGTGRLTWSAIPGGVAGADPSAAWPTLERFAASMSLDERTALFAAIDRCRTEQVDFRIEPRLQLEKGTAWIEIRARLRADESERFVGVYLDITERKVAEQELRRALDAADDANRARNRFLAMMSHELRTPLTPAYLAARAWQSTAGLPPELLRDLRMIGNSIHTESRLIDDLLDLTAIARGSMRIQRRPIRLSEIVDEALGSLSRPSEAADTRLEVHQGAGDATIDGDPTRIQQIIWNIVGNALKFTPNGGRVELSTRMCGEATVELVVRDNGAGIEPGLIARIFEPFERGDTPLAHGGGLGLGLSISRTIVELHGGTIEATSPGPGKGATVRVTFPTIAPIPARDLDEAPPPEAGAIRILLVEDHAGTAEVLSRLLRLKGHAVDTAASISTALELVESREYDLLISDVGLPDGTGFELLQQIRRTHALPAIALTGYGAAEDVMMAKKSGFATHLTKPADLDDLQAAIQEIAPCPSAAGPD